MATLAEAHTRTLSSVLRNTPENVGRQSQRQAASGQEQRGQKGRPVYAPIESNFGGRRRKFFRALSAASPICRVCFDLIAAEVEVSQ